MWKVRLRLQHLWQNLTSGYWFVPSLMLLAAVLLAQLMLHIDHRLTATSDPSSALYVGGSDGAKTVLSTIASSVVTVAGVVFSITIAALSQASSQFGPRLLRNFMRDRSNQLVLGTFVATFMYCLLVLRTIRGEMGDEAQFVPQASVSVAVLLAATSTAVLVYFVHHVSVSLQAPEVVGTVRVELEKAIASLPQDASWVEVPRQGDPTAVLPAGFDDEARPIPSPDEGYLQAVDYEALVDSAIRKNVILRLAYRPGDFVIPGTTLLWVWPAERWEKALDQEAAAAFICGSQATPEQDIEYAIRQMVEVAVRALSPAISDPFTAINCIDALGSVVCQLARRQLPDPLRFDDQGKLRLLTPVTTFDGILDTAFNLIRQHGRESFAVILRLLEVFKQCAEQFRKPGQRRTLLRHAEMLYRQSQNAFPEQHDRQEIRERWNSLAEVLAEAEEAGRAWGAQTSSSTSAPNPSSSGSSSARTMAPPSAPAAENPRSY